MNWQWERKFFALLLVLLFAGSTCSVAQDQASYEINAILSMTGFGAFTGKTQSSSLAVFEGVTNANGGINGRRIKINFLDDQSNPQIAVQLVNQLIAKHAAVILGPAFTATCSAVQALLAVGPVAYCLSPGVHPSGGSFLFSANPGTASIVATEMRFAREHGWTRLALMLTTDATGQDLGEQIDKVLEAPENKQMHVVARQVFNASDISVAAQISNIRNAQPQMLFVGVSGTPFATVLRAVQEAGLDVPIIAPSANMHLDVMAQYTSILPHQLFFGSSRGAVAETAAEARVRHAQAAFVTAMTRAGSSPSNGNVVWDAAQIVVDALRHYGPSATAVQIRDYIASLRNWTGIDGTYDFRQLPQRGIGDDGTIIYTWNPAASQFKLASKPEGRL